MKLMIVWVIVAGMRMLTTALPRTEKSMVDSDALQSLVTTEGLMENLRKLQDIATANGGNRAFGLPGYDASVDFILSQTKNSPNFVTYVQYFPAQFWQVDSLTFHVDNVSYPLKAIGDLPSTSPEGITAPLMLGASGSESCSNEAWDSLDVEGKIVLIEEGSYPNETVLTGGIRYAAAAGALSVVIYHDGAPERVPGLLAPDHRQYVPGATMKKSDVMPLLTRLLSGEKIEAYFQLTQTFENRTTQNVITETEDGDPTNVIMVGAHLDSVQKGPGINDNGSGTSLILALKIALEKFSVTNKVRFAWWGAEENGGIGSQFYTKHLDALSADNILAYLNFDMASHGPFQILDGDGSSYNESLPPGSDVIERIFFNDMTRKGINVSEAEFTNRSDHASFWGLGKPIGGLTTGWGEDPCYHRACDNYDNANPTTLTVNAKAAAHVLAVLATKGHEIVPRDQAKAERGR